MFNTSPPDSEFRADFKTAVRNLCRMHQEMDTVLVDLRGTSLIPLLEQHRLAVRGFPPEGLCQIEGRQFSGKQLRKVLFENREWYDRHSPTTCLWSVYNPETNQSVFGVGTLILAAEAVYPTDVILPSPSDAPSDSPSDAPSDSPSDVADHPDATVPSGATPSTGSRI